MQDTGAASTRNERAGQGDIAAQLSPSTPAAARADRDALSTGCGMAVLSWLLSKRHSLGEIAQAMVGLGDAGTLAALYAKLTGDDAGNAWSTFKAAVEALPNGVTTDDPFNGLAAAAGASGSASQLAT